MGKAEKTRHLIIEQTAPIFNKKGYAGTSLSDLSEATKLTKGALYGNFRNKDEIAIAAFDYNLQKVIEGIQLELAKESSCSGKLLAYVRFYKNSFKKSCFEFGCPIMNTAIEADDTHPELKKKVNKVIMMWDKGIQDLINKGISSNEFKSTVDPPVFSARMISLIEGGILLSKSTGNLRFLKESLKMVEWLIKDITTEAKDK